MESTSIYKRIWEMAFDKGLIEIHYPNQTQASRMRLNLYVNVQKYRAFPDLDPAFSEKLEKLELTRIEVDGSHIVRISLKNLNPLALKAAQQLGILSDSKEEPE